MGKLILHPVPSPILQMITIVFACWLALAGVLNYAHPVQAQSGPLDISISGSAIPAVVGEPWSRTYTATGGTGNYTCSISGEKPSWLSFNPTECKLFGTPEQYGIYAGMMLITIEDDASPPNSATTTLSNVSVEAETETTLSIRSGHPDGTTTYMVGFPVWVHAEVNYTSAYLSGEDPAGTVEISSGTGGPTCSIDLENGEGECALVFDTTGQKTIRADYDPESIYVRASTASHEPITVQSLVVLPALSTGRNHTCYLDANGMMKCWGYEGGFELLDDENGDKSEPEPRGPYSKISAGNSQTCGLKIDGKIECWGENTDVTYPNNIPQGTFVDISSGDEYVCAIDNINQLHCWGNIAASDPLLNNLPDVKVTAVSAGNKFACAIQKSNDQPICWGSSAVSPETITVKQLAVGNTHACAIKTDGNLACWGLAGSPPTGTFKAVTSGSDYSCAQKADGTLTCWGINVPQALDTATSFSQFDSGFLHTCALKPSGETHTLSCWGENKHAKAPRIVLEPSTFASDYLRNGDDISHSLTASGGNEPYTIALVSGSSLPAGLTLVDGTISGKPTTPGDYSFTLSAAETIDGSSLPLELTPARITYETTVYDPATTISMNLAQSSVSAGSAVLATAVVNRSSLNSPPLSGSVEIASTDEHKEASCLAELKEVETGEWTAECNLYFSTPGEKTVMATFEENDAFAESTSAFKTITINPVTINPVVGAGNQFSCSIDSDGQLTCWGDNDSEKATPPATGAYKQLDLGSSHACAVGLNRQVTCWGGNNFGAGDPPALTGIARVATGIDHSCALSDSGKVQCWGRNNSHQTAVPPGVTFTFIDAGNYNTCGLTNIGAVQCWGSLSGTVTGPFTDLGAGSHHICALNSSGMPICWGGLTASGGPYTDLAVGGSFACGLKIDGSVSCWGGMTKGLPGPFSQISAGEDHACGLLTGGGIQCWGGNSHGQAPVINITPKLLGPMDVGATWSGQINANGGRLEADYAYSLSSGELPPGLALDSNEGRVSGTLTQAGKFNFTVLAQETGYEPAIAATWPYEVTVKGRVDASIDAALPANAMIGQPVQVSFSVHAQTGDEMGSEPTGTVTVTADDNECIVDLVDGEGNCTMLFATPGTKTLSITYPGDGLYQPGQSSTEYEVIPFSQPVQIRTGGTRTYVHQPDGAVNCLGGTCESEALPGTFTRFDVGSGFACGLRFDGSAKGEIVCRADDGATAPEFTNGPYIDLSVGVNHACALKLDGTVQCLDADGEITSPADNYAALSAGGDHTCALDDSGEATCWGAFDTAPAETFDTLTSGDHHTCGIKNDNSVVCWGDDSDGQIAVPDSPAAFAQIAAGGKQTCGLDAEGHAFCWGDDEYGQSSPAYGHFIAVDTAGDHTCALRELGSDQYGFTCWGAAGSEAPQYEQFTSLTANAITVLEDFFHPFFPSESNNKPKSASVFAGSLPPGICTGTDCGPGTVVEPQPGYTPQSLSGSGMNLYGTPTVPGEYEFAIQWTDDSAIPLIFEHPYWLTVTGGDLKVELTRLTAFNPMPGTEYWFRIEVTNQTQLPVPGSVLTVQLPTDLQITEINGVKPEELHETRIEGAACELTESILTCHLDDVPGNSPISFTVGGLVTQKDGSAMRFTAQVDSTIAEWPELNPDDNSDAFSVPVVSRTILSIQDYEWLPDAAAAPNEQKFYKVAGGPGLINFTETYTHLPPHRDVWISFDLYIIGGWLGNNTPDGEPSRFTFGHAGQLLDTTFSNDPAHNQAYPRDWPWGNNPYQSDAVGTNELGYEDEIDGSSVPDARYHLSFQFQHDGDEIEMIFTGIDVPDGAAWGIDNLTLEVGFSRRLVFLPLITTSR